MISDEVKLPEEFLKQMKQLLVKDYDKFCQAMNGTPETSIKINRRKCNDVKELGYENLQPVKWCSSGFYLQERPLFTANPLLHAGVFYVQDASSMIYEEVIHKIMPTLLDTSSRPRILDLCAAPGGKTTSIINSLPDDSFVVANEYVPQRASILRENLIKWGYPNIAITNSPTKDICALQEMFDLIAVDAPCSGEGMMRKDDTAVNQWGYGLQNQCVSLQREILKDAYKALKPGGILIYSTCTFNRKENEENAEFITNELQMFPLDLDFPEQWGIGRGIDTEIPCYRFMPHITRGEGLFLAVFRKEDSCSQTSPVSDEVFVKNLKAKTKIISIGIPQTIEKGKLSIPASESVLSTDFNPDRFPSADLSLEGSRAYLRHEALRLSEIHPKGFVVVKYKGHPLGLVKNIGSRANNLYPSNWKIRMQLQ